MKPFVLLSFLVTATAAVAADPIKFISPDEFNFTATVSKAGTIKDVAVVPKR